MNYAALLGLSIFFGFAFEEFYGQAEAPVPGGVRTFPLISFLGAALYLIEPHYAAAFIAGLFVLGLWAYAYIRDELEANRKPVDGPLIVPACGLIAYALGPLALTQPLWISVALIVGAVLLVGARKPLHDLVQRIPREEVLTAGQFLALVGVALPLLYGRPNIPYTEIAPFSVALAVVAVSTLSYASYLLQRYVLPAGGVLVAAALGGLYSSTATTVVLARAAADGVTTELTAGIILATAMMYLRLAAVIAVFDLALARKLIVPLLVLALLAAAVAGAFLSASRGVPPAKVNALPGNPLRLGTALLFAVLMIVMSLLSHWVQAGAGAGGVMALAAVVGVTDIDPFVLSLAQGGAASIGLATAASAILIASSSNDVLKAIYTLAFARHRASFVPAAALGGLSLAGLLAAWILAR